jgi:hypothetical protein
VSPPSQASPFACIPKALQAAVVVVVSRQLTLQVFIISERLTVGITVKISVTVRAWRYSKLRQTAFSKPFHFLQLNSKRASRFNLGTTSNAL